MVTKLGEGKRDYFLKVHGCTYNNLYNESVLQRIFNRIEKEVLINEKTF
ncbi:hypothetical protein KAJ87_00395 [Candidatus Pacearchaeota archaeon]|nr:hypothetical protein [Candidatus Pacearchaeota archaeon]